MIPNLIRRFVIMAVAVPLAAAGARKLSEKLEAKRGSTRATRLLRQGADALGGMRPQKKRRFSFR
ncbi:hypothetical protein BJ973_004723 [Actinoplanes tereljensis]|uniref:Uncharacterized protein n=1 Tax=Paractinoplanes tereljensis TaxID=571912 RepID=A0A919TSW4_9ACTN|nr:hypothetical protein [Actinoplanes tereljensis]GIF21828.1 hypothetical protein Ate02nite_45580 [Actinoplanes tereljensis]